MTILLIILETFLVIMCGFIATVDFIAGNIFGGITYTFCTACWFTCLVLNIKRYINERSM